MGLDQYAYARKGYDGKEENYKFAQWRKHANLQGWMEELYRERGGKEEFNCIDLRLFEEDILRLSKEHKDLKETSGFFFGQSSDYDIEQTEEFIELALDYLSKGYQIVYSSWW